MNSACCISRVIQVLHSLPANEGPPAVNNFRFSQQASPQIHVPQITVLDFREATGPREQALMPA